MRTTAWLAATLLLFGSTGIAQTQRERTEGRQNQVDARGADAEKVGIDRGAAIGHALCMAIEGSELWSCAQQSRSSSAGREDTRRGTDSASALQQHARDSFMASTRLFDAVATDKAKSGGPASKNCEAFYQAARRYSQALEACCRNSGAETGTRISQNTRPRANAGAGNSPDTASSQPKMDPAQLSLLNHAVKEAVEGVGLHKMIQHHNDRSETATALDEHAKAMLRSSEQALRSASGSSYTSRSSGKPVIQGGNANLPKRDPNLETTTGAKNASQGPNASNEDLPSLAAAVIEAVKNLEKEQPGTARGSTNPASNRNQ